MGSIFRAEPLRATALSIVEMTAICMSAVNLKNVSNGDPCVTVQFVLGVAGPFNSKPCWRTNRQRRLLCNREAGLQAALHCSSLPSFLLDCLLEDFEQFSFGLLA